MSNLVGNRKYVRNARVSLFEDGGAQRHRDVLIVVGDRWTILDGEAFRKLAERFLEQL